MNCKIRQSGLIAILALAACGNDQTTPGSSTGTGGKTSQGSGGAAGTGGTKGTGGSVGSGGSSVGSGGATTGSGGKTTGSGGSPGTGGLGVMGGSSGTGGNSSSAGSSGRGGSSGTGGNSSSAGSSGKGGSSGTGGGSGSGVDGGGSTPAGQSAGCGKTSTITSSQYNNGTTIPITVNGSQRRYILNIPKPYDNTVAYKLVIATHELNGNDKEMYAQNYYGLLPLSNNTTIFAAPNGVNGSTPCSGTGSGDSGCGWPAGNNNMQLMDAVVKQITDNFCIDTNRIFATGWSYGASMSYEIGCERPLGGPTATANWGVRAVANYAVAQMSGSCKPSSSYPVAYYLSHGTNDSVLTYDGTNPRHTATTGEAGGVGLAKNWATADGCTWQIPTKVISGAHVCTKFAGCKSGYPVEFCSFNGDHVAFPDSNVESSSWGPQEVWTFFSQF
jgi:poly(3-hydroxybutyrate) depolymerase